MDKEYEKDQQKPKDQQIFPYKVPSVVTFYNWLHNFHWKERVIDRYYEQADKIKDRGMEYTQYMYEVNTEISMGLVNAHRALTNIYNTLTIHLDLNNPEAEDIVEIQTKIGYQLIALTQLQFNSPNTINKYIPTIEEWKAIKDRLQPHHNWFATEEENLNMNIETIDYFYDNYVKTD